MSTSITANSALGEISIQRLRFPETRPMRITMAGDRGLLRYGRELAQAQTVGGSASGNVAIGRLICALEIVQPYVVFFQQVIEISSILASNFCGLCYLTFAKTQEPNEIGLLEFCPRLFQGL